MEQLGPPYVVALIYRGDPPSVASGTGRCRSRIWMPVPVASRTSAAGEIKCAKVFPTGSSKSVVSPALKLWLSFLTSNSTLKVRV